jgi:hypothetical protein
MNLFGKKFVHLLEADRDAEQQPKPASDREAMAQQLDTAQPQDFDVQQQGRAQLMDQHKVGQIKQLDEWIGQLDTFIEFLNGTSPDSIQSKLHEAPCETIFQDIARSEKKKIARLAAELSSLSESFKGYKISAND